MKLPFSRRWAPADDLDAEINALIAAAKAGTLDIPDPERQADPEFRELCRLFQKTAEAGDEPSVPSEPELVPPVEPSPATTPEQACEVRGVSFERPTSAPL